MNEALQLYELLHEHLPEIDLNADTVDILDYVSKILSSMQEKKQEEKYIKALMFMTGKSFMEIISMPVEKLLVTFADCLAENQLYFLINFCKQVGYYA